MGSREVGVVGAAGRPMRGPSGRPLALRGLEGEFGKTGHEGIRRQIGRPRDCKLWEASAASYSVLQRLNTVPLEVDVQRQL